MNLNAVHINAGDSSTYESIDPVTFFPDELVIRVFSHLNLSSLGTIGLVNKKWKQLADEPALWKNAIYREIAFTSYTWAKVFGEKVVKDEDRKEEYSSFPWKEFIADCNKFKAIFPGKKALDTLMIVRLPKTLNGNLTLKSLGELTKKHFSDSEIGYNFIWPNALEEFGDKSIDKSRWVIMTKDVLPKSRGKSYSEQQEIVEKLATESLQGYGISDLIKYSACILSQYFSNSNSQLFGSKPCTFTRTSNRFKGNQIVIGGVSPKGLTVSLSLDGNYTGVAVLREDFEEHIK